MPEVGAFAVSLGDALQQDLGLEVNKWVAVGLALFMILALWLFPEAKAKPGDRQGSDPKRGAP